MDIAKLPSDTSISVKSRQHVTASASTYTAASPQASNRPGAEPVFAMGTSVVLPRSSRSCGSGNLQGTGDSEGGVGACVGPSGVGASHVGGDAGVRELVAASVAEVLETLNTCDTVKIGGDAGVRELVAASVAEALKTLLAAALQEKAQREKAQREKAQREGWRQREEAQRETNTNYNSRVNIAIRHNLRPNSGREQIMAWWRQRGKVQRVARFSD